MNNPSEVATLVEHARMQPAAFAEVYHLYVKRVCGYIFHQVGDVHDAEDLTTQVFIAAWEALPRYQEKGIFAAWLFGIARNKVVNSYRLWRPKVHLEGSKHHSGDNWDPIHCLEQNESINQLLKLIGELGSEEREMLRLRFAANLSYREIGNILGKSEAAIKMKMMRLLRDLQIKWETTDEGTIP